MTAIPTIAVLAGGLATRLGELSRSTPKSLLDVLGRPFLAWQLDLFAAAGLARIVLCIGHHGEQIEEWVARHPQPGLDVRFSRDGNRQLGTGGALRKALPQLGDRFLVTYGDSYLRCDYLDVFRRFTQAFESGSEAARPLGLMTVFRNEDQFDTSNVVFRDGTIVCYDKSRRTPEMRHIDWGLGVLTGEAFAEFPDDVAFDLATVYGSLVAKQRLAGVEMRERFYEVGSRNGLEELRGYLRASSPREIGR
jgi:NDP-sugar pyrophosphorylase family protein